MRSFKGSFRVLMGVVSLLLAVLLLGLAACRPAEVEPAPAVPAASGPVEAGAPAAEEEVAASDPVAVTEAFYAWYLAYNDPEQGRNALVDHAYRESAHLSARWIGAVDAQLEQMGAEHGGAGFDPFLMAQALPQEMSVEAWEAEGEEACVVVHHLFGETVHDLTADLVLEDGVWKIDRIREGSPMTPDGVTRLFLNDYLAQAKASMDGGEPSMLQSGAYRDHELLSAAFVAQVEATVAGFDQGGFDPFLLAQDVPHAINVGEPVVVGDAATVHVGRYYAGNPQPTTMAVELVVQDGRWVIDDIRPLEEAGAMEGTGPAAELEAVVDAFYAEWRQWVQEGFAGERENPLMSGAYHDSAYIAPAFAQKVDAIVAGFAEAGGGYDPFLCAQDVPGEVAVEGTIFTESGPRVAVRTSFNNHALVVALEQAGDGWQIRDVVCPGAPESNAEIFYTWYLAYARNCCVPGATDPGMQRSPLVDGAYHDAPFISPAFAAEVEAALAEMRAAGGSGYDPILQAQAFPPDFSVAAGEGEGAVIVDMAFANAHRLAVQMVQVDGPYGRWLVGGVRLLEEAVTPTPAGAGPDTAGWTTVTDAEHGFSFKIPPGWVAQEQDLQAPGMPDDWPVLQQYLVMPQALAEELAAQSGPPKGNEIVKVPPFVVSYLYGDQAAFDRVYVSAADVQTVAMNGKAIAVQRQSGNISLPRYVFHSEEDPLRWVIVEDVVNEFPGREEQAGEVFGVLDGILMTMSLDG